MDERQDVEMDGVKEYHEEYPVVLRLGKKHRDGMENIYKFNPENRWLIVAENEGGYNSTAIDLCELIEWLKKHRPDLLI